MATRKTHPDGNPFMPGGASRASRAGSARSGRRGSASQLLAPNTGDDRRRTVREALGLNASVSPKKIDFDMSGSPMHGKLFLQTVSPRAPLIRGTRVSRKSEGPLPKLVFHSSSELSPERAVFAARFHGSGGECQAKMAFEAEIQNRGMDNSEAISQLISQWKHELTESKSPQKYIENEMRYALRLLISGPHDSYQKWNEFDIKKFKVIALQMPDLVAMLLSNESPSDRPIASVLDHAFLALNSAFLNWFNQEYVELNLEGNGAKVRAYYRDWHDSKALRVTPLSVVQGGHNMGVFSIFSPSELLTVSRQHSRLDREHVQAKKMQCSALMSSWISAERDAAMPADFSVNPDTLTFLVQTIESGGEWPKIEDILFFACGNASHLTPARRRIGEPTLRDVLPVVRKQVLNTLTPHILDVVLGSKRSDTLDLIVKLLQFGAIPTLDTLCAVCKLVSDEEETAFLDPSPLIQAVFSAMPQSSYRALDKAKLQQAVDSLLAGAVGHRVSFLPSLQRVLSAFGPVPKGTGLLLKSADFPIEQAIGSGDPVFVLQMMRSNYSKDFDVTVALPIIKKALEQNEPIVAVEIWRDLAGRLGFDIALSECKPALEACLVAISTHLKSRRFLALFDVPRFFHACGLADSIKSICVLHRDSSDHKSVLQRAVENGQEQVFLKVWEEGDLDKDDVKKSPSVLSLAIRALIADPENQAKQKMLVTLMNMRIKTGLFPTLDECAALLQLPTLDDAVKVVLRYYLAGLIINPEFRDVQQLNQLVELYVKSVTVDVLMSERYLDRGYTLLMIIAQTSLEDGVKIELMRGLVSQLKTAFPAHYLDYLGLCGTLDTHNYSDEHVEPLQMGDSFWHIVAMQPNLSDFLTAFLGELSQVEGIDFARYLEHRNGAGQTPFHTAAMAGNHQGLEVLMVTYSPQHAEFIKDLLNAIHLDCDMPLDFRVSPNSTWPYSIWHIASTSECLAVLCEYKDKVGPKFSVSDNAKSLFEHPGYSLESLVESAYHLGNGSAFEFWIRCGAMVLNKDIYKERNVDKGRLFFLKTRREQGFVLSQTKRSFSSDVICEFQRRGFERDRMMAYVGSLGIGFYITRSIELDDRIAFDELVRYGFDAPPQFLFTETKPVLEGEVRLSILEGVGPERNQLLLHFLIQNHKIDWVTSLFHFQNNIVKWWYVLNKSGIGVMHQAVITGDVAMLRVILDAAKRNDLSVDTQDSHGFTALHWAVLLGCPILFKRLLKGGANPNVRCLDVDDAPDADLHASFFADSDHFTTSKIGVSVEELLAFQMAPEQESSFQEIARRCAGQWSARVGADVVESERDPQVYVQMKSELDANQQYRDYLADELLNDLVASEALEKMVAVIRNFQLKGVDVFSANITGDTLLTRWACSRQLDFVQLELLIRAVLITSIHPELWGGAMGVSGFLHAYRGMQNAIVQPGQNGQNLVHALVGCANLFSSALEQVRAVLDEYTVELEDRFERVGLTGERVFERLKTVQLYPPVELFKHMINDVLPRDMPAEDATAYFAKRGVLVPMPESPVRWFESSLVTAARIGNVALIPTLVAGGALANNSKDSMGVLSAVVMRECEVRTLDHFDEDTLERLKLVLEGKNPLPFTWREKVRVIPMIEQLKPLTVLHWAIARGLQKTVAYLLDEIMRELNSGKGPTTVATDGDLRSALEFAHFLTTATEHALPLKPVYAQCVARIQRKTELVVDSQYRSVSHRVRERFALQQTMLAELEVWHRDLQAELDESLAEFNRRVQPFFDHFHSQYHAIMIDVKASNKVRHQQMLELLASFNKVYQDEMGEGGSLYQVHTELDRNRKSARTHLLLKRAALQKAGITATVSLNLPTFEQMAMAPHKATLERQIRGGAKQLAELSSQEMHRPIEAVHVSVDETKMGPYAKPTPPKGAPSKTGRRVLLTKPLAGHE